MEYIAGFTESGVPFGIFDDEDNDKSEIQDTDDELPF